MRDSAAAILKLIERLYDAAADPGSWPAFLEALAVEVGGVAPAIYLTEPTTDTNLFHVVCGSDPSWSSAYEGYFKRCDLRRARIKTLPAGSVFVGSALISDRDLIRSEFYNDFLQPQGYFHILGTVPVKLDDSVAVLRVIRPRSTGPFGPAEVGLLRRLEPHLARTIRLQQLVSVAETRRDEASEILDRFPAGVMLLDADGRLVASNRVAEALLAAGDGLRAGREGLRASGASDTAALQRLVARASAPNTSGDAGEGILSIHRTPPKRPLNLLIVPLRSGLLAGTARRAAVAVFVTDPERAPATSVDRLRLWLGLTRAEAALVHQLVRGLRVEDAAEVLHISTHTARTQLKRALAKTGTGRQAELLRLALATPAVLAG